MSLSPEQTRDSLEGTENLRSSSKSAAMRMDPVSARGSVRGVAMLATMQVFAAVAAASEAEPGERLPAEERRLIAGLVHRGMPELIEPLIAGRPAIHRIHVARACVRAGVDESSPERREALLTKAAEEYRRVIALGDNPGWLRGERRRFDSASWRVEFADAILRYWIAEDLDQFEITSGLEFNRDRLLDRLAEASRLYSEAGVTLRQLDVGLRTNEEEYLLLGIAGEITQCLDRQRLNSAWAKLYAAMALRREDVKSRGLLTEALSAFDAAAYGGEDDAGRKYNALLGIGIALGGLQRCDEADAVFERILSSTAPYSAAVRAQFERARVFLDAKSYDQARRELDRLGSLREDESDAEDAGAMFFVRLAPLIRAYSYLCEARQQGLTPQRRRELEGTAQSEFLKLHERGGPWPGMVRVYLDRLSGAKRDLNELADAELVMRANGLMAEKKFEEAVAVWRALLAREKINISIHEPRFNLGVCYFQTRKLRAAADVFLEEARSDPPATIAERVFEYAYRCHRELAAETDRREDYRKLAETAELLVTRRPDHRLASEAAWVAALALEESGSLDEARAAYGRISASSPEYWQARRNAARCAQRIYESASPETAVTLRSRYARSAADDWLRLSDDLGARSKNAGRKTGGQAGEKPPFESNDLMVEARLAAASVLASEELGEFRRSLELLEGLPPGSRWLGLRIRCLQGLGRIEEANKVLDEYLRGDASEELGAVLLALAAEMEGEIKRLEDAGRREDAKRMAIDTIPTMTHLLRWIEAHPSDRKHVALVRFSLAGTLVLAGRDVEALEYLDALVASEPDNGEYVQKAALLHEERSIRARPSQRSRHQDEAESLWARLLKDPSLRKASPAEYWQARYHWLKHQLRHGRAAQVLKGIESERAWHPDLGGPPWQNRLLLLAEEARLRMETGQP